MNATIKKFMKEFETRIPISDIYLVGGAVRNELMGVPVSDYDFATSAHIDAIESAFTCIEIGKSKDFGIIAVQYNGECYEIAHYRSDRSYENCRHPTSVDLDVTIYDDSCRRDFSMNSLYQAANGDIVDFHNGQQDIKDGIIRSINNPEDRIQEDVLRVLRALRFAVTFNFKIEDSLKTAIIENFHLIEKLSPERIQGEILKVASKGGKVFYKYLKLVEDLGGMKYLFPEIEEMKNFKHWYEHHPEGALQKCVKTGEIGPLSLKNIEDGSHVVYKCGTVYDHQMAVMSCVPEYANEFVVLSALYHDIGKVHTAELNDPEMGTYSFKSHEYKGVAVFEELAKKRKIGGLLRDCIMFCIEQHMNMNNKELSKKSTILNMALNPFFDVLTEVSRADDRSRNVHGNILYVEEEFNANLKKFTDARNSYEDTSKLKSKIAEYIDGKKVMEFCGLPPCKRVGEIISEVTEELIESDFTLSVEDVDQKIRSLK